MSSVSIPYPLFVAGTTAVATQVNDNNTAIVDYINANCITKDGTESFTHQQPTLVGDPTDPTHLARKAYVDTTTNKMSGSLTQVVQTPVQTFTAFNTLTAVTSDAIVVPSTWSEALTLTIWGNVSCSYSAAFITYLGSYTVDVCEDFVAAPSVWTTIGYGAVSLNGGASPSKITPNLDTGGMPFRYSAVRNGKTVKVRITVSQTNVAGAGFWTMTPYLRVDAGREIPFA